MLVPCPTCETPIYDDGIGLSGEAHRCQGPLWEQIECYCGQVVWLRSGTKYEQDGRSHKHKRQESTKPVPVIVPPSVEAWGLEIDRSTGSRH